MRVVIITSPLKENLKLEVSVYENWPNNLTQGII